MSDSLHKALSHPSVNLTRTVTRHRPDCPDLDLLCWCLYGHGHAWRIAGWHRELHHPVWPRNLQYAAGAAARGQTMWYLNLHSLPATRVCGNIHARWLSVLLAPGNLETMHDSDLPTFLINSVPIIFTSAVARAPPPLWAACTIQSADNP